MICDDCKKEVPEGVHKGDGGKECFDCYGAAKKPAAVLNKARE